MNLLIDIGHPAHVHLFKNLAHKLLQLNHQVIFTVRSGEKESELLSIFGFEYKIIGNRKQGLLKKVLGILLFSSKIYRISVQYKVDMFLSHGSMYAGYAALLKRKPHIALEDSGNMEQLRFSIPVSNVILSPDVLVENLGKKQIRYVGYHELIYLHPNNLKQEVTRLEDMRPGDSRDYCLLRFSTFAASHDKRQFGLSEEEKMFLIQYLNKKFKVYISSEGELPEQLEKYKFQLPPHLLHQFIAGASLVLSEGATIASEAGVLGIPSIYINTIIRCYNEDLEKYGLVHNFRSFEGVIDKLNDILSISDVKIQYQKRRDNMLKDKIDVNSFLNWFVLNYPESRDTLKMNPDFQFNFGGNKVPENYI